MRNVASSSKKLGILVNVSGVEGGVDVQEQIDAGAGGGGGHGVAISCGYSGRVEFTFIPTRAKTRGQENELGEEADAGARRR